MATEAAAEDVAHMTRNTSLREDKSSLHSSSHHSRRKQTDQGKLRSKSMAPTRSHSRNKELRSGSEDGRKSIQDKLKEMKHLEGSKHGLRSESRRGDTNVIVARAIFDRIDLDGSGTLDRSEIAMLATKMVRSFLSQQTTKQVCCFTPVDSCAATLCSFHSSFI